MIEKIHKNNWEIIKKYNLVEGLLIKNKNNGYISKIEHIHKIYGWVTCSWVCLGNLKQDLSNISDFDVLYKESIINAL